MDKFRFLKAALALLATMVAQSGLAENREQVLQNIVSECQKSDSNVLVIIQDKKVVINKTFRPSSNQLYSVQSVTKSIVSMAYAILIDRMGPKILDTPIYNFIPEWGSGGTRGEVLLKMLLSHTSGLIDDADMWNAPDTVKYAISKGPTQKPGTSFHYSNLGVTLLAPIFKAISGVEIDAFVMKNIFGPLQITDSTWSRDGAGNVATSGGLFLSVDDLIKIGQLMLDKGHLGPRQIMSEAEVSQMTEVSQPYYPYGYLWWLYKESANTNRFSIYSAVGYGGEYLTIYPEKRIIAIRLRQLDDNPNRELITQTNFPELIGNL